MNHKRQEAQGRRWRRRLGMTLGLVLAGGVLVGCDDLLEVDLPDAVTDEALEDPASAEVQLNGLMGQVECGLSSFAYQAAGYEDNYEMIAGAYGSYSQYNAAPAGGTCDAADDDYDWFDPLSIARRSASFLYDKLENEWTVEQVPNREEIMAQTALYAGISLETFGTFFCEMAIDAGPLMTYEETLGLAEDWVTTSLDHVGSTGDFELINGITGDEDDNGIEEFAHAIRARIRWAAGDEAGALADIALVPDGFTAWITRESGPRRRNKVHFFVDQPSGPLLGPIDDTRWDDPAPSYPGYFDPVWAGDGWPNPIPFTGYLDLAILPDGRAIGDDGYPVTLADVGAVEDGRVQHELGTVAAGGDVLFPVARPPLVTSQTDNQPLVSWRELKLIEAELRGGADAIALVNELRDYHGLPAVTYADPGDADQVENMIIEERRRELWLQGRYWATKIQNTDKLWFPRDWGAWPTSNLPLNGGVRLAMQGDEYELNDNFDVGDRGTGCPAGQAPIVIG